MKDRTTRLKCAKSFATMHNVVMCAASLVVACVGLTGAVLSNRFENMDTLICRPEYATSRPILGVQLIQFAVKALLISSMIQLGDTFVSIANKKKLDVAHQLHHLTVIQSWFILLCCA